MKVKINKNLRDGKVVGSICDLTLNPSEKFDGGWSLSDEQAEYLRTAQAVTITLLGDINPNVEPRSIDDLPYTEELLPVVEDDYVGYKQFNGFLTRDADEISFIIDNDRYLIDCDDKVIKFDENYEDGIKGKVKFAINPTFTTYNENTMYDVSLNNLGFDGYAYFGDFDNFDRCLSYECLTELYKLGCISWDPNDKNSNNEITISCVLANTYTDRSTEGEASVHFYHICDTNLELTLESQYGGTPKATYTLTKPMDIHWVYSDTYIYHIVMIPHKDDPTRAYFYYSKIRTIVK